MAPMRTVREGQQSMGTETKGGNLPKKRKKEDIMKLKLPGQVPDTVKSDCEQIVLRVCVCVYESPYRTAAAGVGLRTPETWAFPDVRLKPLRTAASRTYTAAECPA